MPQFQKNLRAVSPALTFEGSINGTGDIKVLNYALALEALETDLYAQALLRLTTGGQNALGQTIAGLGLSDSDSAVIYVRDFGKIEATHKAFLESVLGSQAITKGTNPLANAKFDFGFSNANQAGLPFVLEQIRVAEKTGVGAYLGAIPLFATGNFIGAAAAIQGTEARHTATITALINQRGLNVSGEPSPLPVAPRATPGNPTSRPLSGIDVPILPKDVLITISPFIVL